MLKIFKIITRDVPYFLQFFGIVIMGFSCAVAMISNKDSDVFFVEYGFIRLLLTMWTFIKITVDAQYIGELVDIANVPPQMNWLFDLLMTTFGFVATLLMLNLLIAIIGTSYDEYDKAADRLLLLERYNIMCSMERTMSAAEVQQRMETYSIGHEVDIDGRVLLFDSRKRARRDGAGKVGGADDGDNGTGNGNGALVDKQKNEITLPGIRNQKSLNSFREASLTAWGHVVKKIAAMLSFKRPAGDGVSVRWNYKWEINDKKWFTRKREAVFMPDSSTVKIILLIIDPQNDFHDDPEVEGQTRGYTGSLAVPGATADSLRIRDMIMDNMDDIDEVYVTLDTHHVSYHT